MWQMLRPRRAVLCALLLLAALLAALPTMAHAQGRVVLAVWGAPAPDNYTLSDKTQVEPKDRFLRELNARPAFSIGLLQSIQGDYNLQQTLLDISQGTRQSNAIYNPRDPIPLTVVPSRGGANVQGWSAADKRAHDVSVTIQPGLLGHSIPGGAAFVGITGQSLDPAIAAANRHGHVAAISLGPASTLAQRTQEMLRRKSFVVVGLPPNDSAFGTLDQLASQRVGNDILMATYLPPTIAKTDLVRPPVRLVKLVGFAYDDGSKSRGVTSATTRQPGLVVSIDILPTVLDRVGISAPKKARGTVMKTGERRDAAKLEELRRRWSDIRGARQSSSLRQVVGLALLIMLIVGVARGMSGIVGPALRTGALACMWWPTAVLAVAPLHPTKRLTETALIAALSVAAGMLTDRFVKWPRGPLVPAAVGLFAYTLDLALGSRLLTTSVLGPSITFGARFYGVSNELEPLLPVLALVGMAAYFAKRPPTPRLPLIYAGAGLLMIGMIGWGRIGADVGGVFTVGGAFAVATLIVTPGQLTKRRVGLALLSLPAALVVLLLLDLGLSGGDHLSRNLGRTQGLNDLWELVARRYELSYKIFMSGRPAAYFAGAALAVAFAVRNRAVIYSSVTGQPIWAAALWGGLAGGAVGALTNDSGPILFTNAIIALTALTAYIVGDPARAPATPVEPPADEDAPATAASQPPAAPALAS
jgi:hypothetical protein